MCNWGSDEYVAHTDKLCPKKKQLSLVADSSRKPWNDAWEIMLFVMLLIMLNSLCNFAFFGTNGFFPGENNKMIFHHLPPNPLYIYTYICMIFFYIDVSSKISTKNDQPWFFPHQHGPQPNRGPELPGRWSWDDLGMMSCTLEDFHGWFTYSHHPVNFERKMMKGTGKAPWWNVKMPLIFWGV